MGNADLVNALRMEMGMAQISFVWQNTIVFQQDGTMSLWVVVIQLRFHRVSVFWINM
jgi:hypothetical protein